MSYCCSCFDFVIVDIVVPVLAVGLASAEVRQAMYDPEQSCTTDEPQTLVKKRSKLHCASACSGQLECKEFNFDESTEDCSMYKHKPSMLYILDKDDL